MLSLITCPFHASSPLLPQHLTHPTRTLETINPGREYQYQLDRTFLMDTNGSSSPVASMNPCANSFAPKPTYADTLKASLPRQQHSQKTSPADDRCFNKEPTFKGRTVTRNENTQRVGYSVRHERDSEPCSVSERKDRVRQSSRMTHDGGPPERLITPFLLPPPPGFRHLPEPAMASPHLQHLNAGRMIKYTLGSQLLSASA